MGKQEETFTFAKHIKINDTMVFTKKLTNLQIELIKLFEYQVEDRQLLEIKDLLARYFADEATKAMDNLWQENGLTNDTMREWSETHMRTPYND